MKSFKQIAEEVLNEGGEHYPADDMTISELKIACYAAQNILAKLEDGAMIQRWQISAIVKAKEELSSVYTSISADEQDEMDDVEAWLNGYDDEEEEGEYVGYEYPSMYGEETELDESFQELSNLKKRISVNTKKMKALPDLHPEKKKLTISVAKDTKKHNELFNKQFGKNEETDYKVSVDGLPDMYVKANSSSEVKNNLRKLVKNPDMIRGVERVAKATLQKIFRDKASGKDEVSEEVEQIDEISDEMKKNYIRAVADKGGILRKPRPASLAGIDKKKEDALVKAFKGGSMQQYADLHKKSERRAEIGTKAIHSLKKEEVDVNEASDLRITKVYNKKKATYAVHSPDRKYYKEFDTMDAAKAHHAEKTGK